MLFMLKKLNYFFKDLNFNFFLMDGALLGSIRQGAIAGRGSDLDIGVVTESEENEKLLISLLQKKFRIKKTSKTSFHIVHEKINIFADLSFFRYIENGTKLYFHWGNDKKIVINKSDILPLKKNMLYHQDCYIPNETSKMLRMIYGENFLTPINKKINFI